MLNKQIKNFYYNIRKKVICWEKFKSLVGSIIIFMYFVCFFVVGVVIDVAVGVGIIGTCGVVLLTVVDPGFLDGGCFLA